MWSDCARKGKVAICEHSSDCRGIGLDVLAGGAADLDDAGYRQRGWGGKPGP